MYLDADPDNANSNSGIGFRVDGTAVNAFLDHSGNFGLGTGNTPSARLHINEATASGGILLTNSNNTAGTYSDVKFQYSAGDSSYASALRFRQLNTAHGGQIEFWTDNSTGTLVQRVTLDREGRFGIGVTNPAVPLDIQSNSSAEGIRVRGRTSDNIAQITLTDSGGTARSQIQSHSTFLNIKAFPAVPMIFYTAGTERCRIGSDGNFIHGTTNANHHTGSSDQGITLSKTFGGLLSASRSGAQPLIVNRQTSDGIAIDVRKDGTSVGGLHSRAGVVTTLVLNPASGNGAGISGGTKCIVPADESGIIDNDISLGISTHRFKDLHLTGSANIGTNILMSNSTTSAFMQVSSNILQFGTSSDDPVAFFTNNSEVLGS